MILKIDLAFELSLIGVMLILFAKKTSNRSKKHLITQLIKADGEIQDLQGLLPVCPSCKRVRDDQGYWLKLEHYVNLHSMVRFSSALCPQCASHHSILILSYFDTKLGPKTFLIYPDEISDESLKEIPSIMDYYPDEDFIIHSIGNYDTANLKFNIECKSYRGNQIPFMISYIVQRGKLDGAFVRTLLMDFVNEFSQIQEVGNIFSGLNHSFHHANEEKLAEIQTMFKQFYQCIFEKKVQYYHNIQNNLNESKELKRLNKELEEEIWEYQRRENALQESEAKYHRLINLMQEGVWVIDAEGITTFVNPRMAEMLGYREKEMIGKPMYDFMAKDMIPLSKFYLNRKAQGVSEQFEFQYLKRNGEPIDCVLETSPVYDENHRFIGALRCVTDITEYKKKEKIFREQEETLRITFDHSSYAIVTTTIDGRIVQFNHTFSALLGYSEKELQNRSMQTIIHQTDYEFNLNLIRQAIEKHLNILSYELRFILKDGTTIWGDVKTSIIFDDLGNPEYLVTLIRDITNRKNDEIETIAEEIARVQVEQEKSQIDGSRTLRGILFKQSTKIE